MEPNPYAVTTTHEEPAPSAARWGRRLASWLRGLIVVFFMGSTTYWLIYALFQFPWIVLADGNRQLQANFQQMAAAGAMLCLLSLASLGATAGLYGRRNTLLVVSVLLTLGWLALVPMLHRFETGFVPRLDDDKNTQPIPLAVHLLGIVANVVGAGLTFQRKANEGKRAW